MSSWPKYFKDRLILGNPDSDSAIATLWTPMNVVSKMADVSKVSIIGQLYTKRGINYLLRNVLLNPKIKRILLTGADLMGAGEDLVQLASKGLTLRSKVRPYQINWLDENISSDAVESFSRNVEIVNQIGPVSSNELTAFVNESRIGKYWSKPVEFPEAEAIGSGGLPSEETIFTVRGQKVWQTWIRLLREITRFGRPSPMIHHYGAERISEIFNLTAVIYSENPENPELPKWLPYSKDDVKKYVAGFLSNSRGDEAYTYGERIKAFPLEGHDDEFLSKVIDFSHCESPAGGRGNLGEIRQTLSQAVSGKSLNQQKLMAAKLKSFPENKGAIAILWEPIIDNFGLREIWRTPCLVLIQAVIRDKKLFLTAYFRSNDMYGGWFLNAFGLLAFQKELAGMIGKDIKLGPLTTISHSAHIYESSWQLAEKLVNDRWIDVSCEWDRRGNLHFETDGKFIVVKHLSPDGIFLDEYRQNGLEEKAAKRLCFTLESAGLFTIIGNAMYAGRQIERAETAVKLGIPFVSDVSLEFKKLK
jgi:thymidylate synthase